MTLRSHIWPLLLSGLFFWAFGTITINLTSESLAPIILSLIAVFSAYQSYKARDAGQKVEQVKVMAETAAVKVEEVKVAAEGTSGALADLKTTADATHVLVNSKMSDALAEIAALKAQILAMTGVNPP